MPDLPSNRQKKRVVADGVRRLLDTPGWNPYDFVAGRQAERGGGESASAQALAAAADCPDCGRARRDAGDPDALCERHLAEALGFSS